MRVLGPVSAMVAGLLLLPAAARAADEDRPAWGAQKFGWLDVLATAFVGGGLRFNNPYRLSTVLGSQAQSISRTSNYLDVGLGGVMGDPSGLAHGLVFRASFAVEGVAQSVLTPAYLALHRWASWGAYGRVGVPWVLSPQGTWGLEAGAGAIWFARAGIGVAAEIVGDVFYGAGTREIATASYPVLSAQGGLFLSWEAMP